MSNIQTGAERMPHDLSHLGFLAGQIGRLITISTTPVIAGDSFEMDAVGKSFTSFSHSTRNKTRDGLIRVRNIRALNGRFNTSITHAYSIVIGSKHITLNA